MPRWWCRASTWRWWPCGADGADRIKIQAELEQIKEFVGISGIYTYTPDNHSGPDERALVMVEVKGGKWTLAP